MTAIPVGSCRYPFNPSEMYQRTKPGMGVETHCGARTYAALDDPELVALTQPDGTTRVAPTGRMLPRPAADPYCPDHGGTPEPPAEPVSVAELEAAHSAYVTLVERFQTQAGGALVAPVADPAELEAAAAPAAAAELPAPAEAEADQAPAEASAAAAEQPATPLAAAFGSETHPEA